MDRIEIETDFASITVAAKDGSNEEFSIRHALHQLIKRYKAQYGEEATQAALNELKGYHGTDGSTLHPLGVKVPPASKGLRVIQGRDDKGERE